MLLFPFVVLFTSCGDWWRAVPVGAPWLRHVCLSTFPTGAKIAARKLSVQSVYDTSIPSRLACLTKF
jgi:hypothetical protein